MRNVSSPTLQAVKSLSQEKNIFCEFGREKKRPAKLCLDLFLTGDF